MKLTRLQEDTVSILAAEMMIMLLYMEMVEGAIYQFSRIQALVLLTMECMTLVLAIRNLAWVIIFHRGRAKWYRKLKKRVRRLIHKQAGRNNKTRN